MLDDDDIIMILLLSSDTSGLNWKGVVLWIVIVTIIVTLISLI